jgi:hypothetical protein
MTSFTQDLFISYAHIDNQAMTADEKGWVSRFHNALEALLSMRLGKRVRICRDDKLQSNDMFAHEITDKFAETAVHQNAVDLITGDVEPLKAPIHLTLKKLEKHEAPKIMLPAGDEGSDEAWKQTLDNELKKSPGDHGGKPLFGRYTCLAQPSTAKKEDLNDMEEDKLIDSLEAFSVTAMTDFMQVLSTAGKA